MLKLTIIIYADNSQLYLHCLAIDQSTDALRLAECDSKSGEMDQIKSAETEFRQGSILVARIQSDPATDDDQHKP